MTNIDDLCAVLARSLGCARDLPARMATALGVDRCAPASAHEAALLLIALLSAETPEQARDRAPLYAALPLADVLWLHPQTADGPMRLQVVRAEDIESGPGNREIVVRTSRSLASAVELFLERCIAAEETFRPPSICLARRSQAPMAFAYAVAPSGLHETLTYAAPGDTDEAHAMASFRMNSFAEVHAVALEAIADFLRERAPSAAAALMPGALLGWDGNFANIAAVPSFGGDADA